jgi:exonuclease III
MADAARPMTIMSWNVYGLGDRDKYGDVWLMLPATPPDIVCLQETKLQNVARFKAASFLPRLLSSSFVFSPSTTSGMLTA